MSQSFRAAEGRKVIAKTTAEEIGKVKSFVVDTTASRVTALQIGGRGGSAELVDWANVNAFGDDAVIVEGADVARAPDDREKEAVKGDIRARGTKVLTTAGYDVGKVHDVMFDGASGEIVGMMVGKKTLVPADRMRSLGSYALVIDAPIEA